MVGRHPQRVPPRSLTCTDDIFGRRTAQHVLRGADHGEGDLAAVREVGQRHRRQGGSDRDRQAPEAGVGERCGLRRRVTEDGQNSVRTGCGPGTDVGAAQVGPEPRTAVGGHQHLSVGEGVAYQPLLVVASHGQPASPAGPGMATKLTGRVKPRKTRRGELRGGETIVHRDLSAQVPGGYTDDDLRGRAAVPDRRRESRLTSAARGRG
jgi:hypothetical protein